MEKGKIQLQLAGKGFVLVASNGLPPMRRLVNAYTGTNKRTYIKIDGKLLALRPSHKFISA